MANKKNPCSEVDDKRRQPRTPTRKTIKSMTNDEDNYDDKNDDENEHEDDVKCVDDEDDQEDMGKEDNDVNVFIIKF